MGAIAIISFIGSIIFAVIEYREEMKREEMKREERKIISQKSSNQVVG